MNSHTALHWLEQDGLLQTDELALGPEESTSVWREIFDSKDLLEVNWPTWVERKTPVILSARAQQEIRENILREGDRPEEIRVESFDSSHTCAIYLPIHFNAHRWGIYIREKCVEQISIEISRFLDARFSPSIDELIRDIETASFQLLRLHEEFHHRVEIFAIRASRLDIQIDYKNYHQHVYRKSWTVDPLLCREEALCDAYVARTLSSRLGRGIHKSVHAAALRFQKTFMKSASGPYQKSLDLIPKRSFEAALDMLLRQLVTADPRGPRRSEELLHLEALMKPVTDLSEHTFLQANYGLNSNSPGVFYLSLPTKKIRRYIKDRGFFPVDGTKHEKWKNSRGQMIVLQGSRKDQHHEVIKSTAETIGVTVKDFADAVRQY